MVRLGAKDGKRAAPAKTIGRECAGVWGEQQASEERHNIAQKELNRMCISCHEANGLLWPDATCEYCPMPSYATICAVGKRDPLDKHVTENVVRNLLTFGICSIEAQCILAQQSPSLLTLTHNNAKDGDKKRKVEGDLPCNLGEENPTPTTCFFDLIEPSEHLAKRDSQSASERIRRPIRNDSDNRQGARRPHEHGGRGRNLSTVRIPPVLGHVDCEQSQRERQWRRPHISAKRGGAKHPRHRFRPEHVHAADNPNSAP